MKALVLIFPVALLIAYSQIIVKWRMQSIGDKTNEQVTDALSFLVKSLSDPVIMSAYAAALIGSFAWLYVVTKLPLVVAFPVYIGITLILVIFGSWWFLSEDVSMLRLLGAALIFCGIILGVRE